VCFFDRWSRFLRLLLIIWSEFSNGKGSVYSAGGADLVESRLPDSANVTSLERTGPTLRTPHKTAWEKGTVPVLLRGLRKKGTVPGGFVRGSKKILHCSLANSECRRYTVQEFSNSAVTD
jgi:hypothetical protein